MRTRREKGALAYLAKFRQAASIDANPATVVFSHGHSLDDRSKCDKAETVTD